MKPKLILSFIFSLLLCAPFSRNILNSKSPKAVYIEEFTYDDLPKTYYHYFESESFVFIKDETYNSNYYVLMEGEGGIGIMKINGNFEILKSDGHIQNNNRIKITYKNSRFNVEANGVKKKVLEGKLTVTELNTNQNTSIKIFAGEIWGNNFK